MKVADDDGLRAVESFLDGLTSNDVGRMPLAEDIVLISPIDPQHPLVGRNVAIDFLQTRVFPKIPVRKAEVERHLVDGDFVATLWTATFAPPGKPQVVVPIFDFFRIENGKIKELRPYFDPQPLKQLA
ncbi:nuclear transport factor 2 family protein [Bradyrhizobium sp.]|uniref:nuclear transport factor 2 family protein n=1 Tax=Bradyrhizobium sp. TaxID=376 RepID=UPI0025BB9BEA|nr:nuclear transport factor 2 family protein [Bradyrhizobium sp.]